MPSFWGGCIICLRIRRIDVDFLNELFSLEKVILELFEYLGCSEPCSVNLLHFFPYFFYRKIDKVLARPSLALIC
jgi:hypothetical protein